MCVSSNAVVVWFVGAKHRPMKSTLDDSYQVRAKEEPCIVFCLEMLPQTKVRFPLKRTLGDPYLVIAKQGPATMWSFLFAICASSKAFLAL